MRRLFRCLRTRLPDGQYMPGSVRRTGEQDRQPQFLSIPEVADPAPRSAPPGFSHLTGGSAETHCMLSLARLQGQF